MTNQYLRYRLKPDLIDLGIRLILGEFFRRSSGRFILLVSGIIVLISRDS